LFCRDVEGENGAAIRCDRRQPDSHAVADVTNCCSSVGAATGRHFNQKKAAKELALYRAKGPGPTTRLLLAALTDAGAVHGCLLDVGSGIGALTFELLDRGLTSAVGVDLSPAHVATATDEAAGRGRSGSTQFLHGDFLDLVDRLPSADIVTLDRVVCCYPHYGRLLAESLRRTGGCFAFSYPRDVWYVRASVWLENLARRITRNAFRTFVHPASAMENAIRQSGFARVASGGTRTWCADVYMREGERSA
jgi:magnesium-protoporphyrin O-methyltransferase